MNLKLAMNPIGRLIQICYFRAESLNEKQMHLPSFKISGLFIALTCVLFACSEDQAFPDKQYPTVLDSLESQQIDELFKSLENTAIYNCTQVNPYGFLQFDIQKNTFCEIDDSLEAPYTEAELGVFAKEAVVRYSAFTHVPDTALLTLNNIKTNKGVAYSTYMASTPTVASPAWFVTFNTQKINSLEVRGTLITVLMGPFGELAINGNWYPEVYIPQTDGLTEEEARQSTWEKTYTSGSYSIKPTEATTWYPSKKIIIPMKRSGQIELRVCWALYPANWEITLDSQNGELISTARLSEN